MAHQLLRALAVDSGYSETSLSEYLFPYELALTVCCLFYDRAREFAATFARVRDAALADPRVERRRGDERRERSGTTGH